MERTLSIEEKIRRAEEIYQKRRGESITQTRRIETNSTEKKNIKLFKKMIIQIIICVAIYGVFCIIQNSESIFSQEVINKTKEVLSYNTNFPEVYQNIKNGIFSFQQNIKIPDNEKNINENNQENNEKKEIVENKAEETTEKTETSEVTENKQEKQENQEPSEQPEAIGGNTEEVEPQKELTEEEQKIENVKNTTTFIKPVQGTISSPFGYRGTATGSVPKNHTGTDLAANLGTKIISATDGEVVLTSEEGDYGKHLKIQIGEVSIIYAHCNSLYVKQGDHITQGQEIAEVGSTGNSTGPHLHFEIRYQENCIDPQKILDL